MSDVRIVPLEPRHASIVARLRRADVYEIWAGQGVSPGLAVSFSIAASSYGRAAEVDGQAVAVFGVRRGRDGVGIPWLVGTDDLERYPVRFFRWSKGIVREMRERFDRLENWVHEDNILSVRWLEWAGFTIEKPERRHMGFFRRFWWERAKQVEGG